MDASRSHGARRAGREPVTPERVTDAALAIIDAEGLEALTMRRLAQDLGVEPMTVYRQYASKDAILASVAERLWASLPPTPATPGPGVAWREIVRSMWLGLHGLMQSHPNAIPLIARGGGASPSARSGTAGMVDVLRRAGLSPDEAGRLVHALSALVVGYGFASLWAREAAARAADGPPSGPPGDAPGGPVAEGAPGDLSPELIPYLVRLGRWDPDEFEAAVTRLLEGYEPR